MNNKSRICLISTLSLLLGSCGGTNKSNIYEKQRTASDIKISSLDLQKNEIQMRFEYRTYVKKTLETIKCELTFNESSPISITQQPNIDLESFSTEILSFANIQFQSSLNGSETINYALDCKLQYNKGKERVLEDSVLHLVPGTNNRFR